MASTSVETQELLDQRLDTIDRALMGLVPRSERLKFMAETEAMLRDRGGMGFVLAEDATEPREGAQCAPPLSRMRRAGRSRLALTSGVLGIVAAALLFVMPVTYVVVSMAGEAIGEMASYALLGLNVLAVALGGAGAVVLGIAALVRLNRRPNRQVGHGWAITGLCAGPVPMLAGGLAMLFVVLPMTGLIVSEYRSTPGMAYIPPIVESEPRSFEIPVINGQTVAVPLLNEACQPVTSVVQGLEEPRQFEPSQAPADPRPSDACLTPAAAKVTEPSIPPIEDAPKLLNAAPNSAEATVTVSYALHNAAVTAVANQLAASLETTCGAMATDAESNTLTVTALPKEQERISQLLAKLDAKPIAVEIKCQLTRMGPDGKRTILSRPQVQTLDGTEAMIMVGSANESIEVTLVPKVILPEQVKDTINHSPLPDGAGGDGP